MIAENLVDPVPTPGPGIAPIMMMIIGVGAAALLFTIGFLGADPDLVKAFFTVTPLICALLVLIAMMVENND